MRTFFVEKMMKTSWLTLCIHCFTFLSKCDWDFEKFPIFLTLNLFFPPFFSPNVLIKKLTPGEKSIMVLEVGKKRVSMWRCNDKWSEIQIPFVFSSRFKIICFQENPRLFDSMASFEKYLSYPLSEDSTNFKVMWNHFGKLTCLRETNFVLVTQL